MFKSSSEINFIKKQTNVLISIVLYFKDMKNIF